MHDPFEILTPDQRDEVVRIAEAEARQAIREVVALIRNDQTARTLDAFAELERITDAVETLGLTS